MSHQALGEREAPEKGGKPLLGQNGQLVAPGLILTTVVLYPTRSFVLQMN